MHKRLNTLEPAVNPETPRLHELSTALLNAHLLRGEIVPLGFGYCLRGAQNSTTARLYTLEHAVPKNSVVCRLTAAWLWLAIAEAPPTLEVNIGTKGTKIRSLENIVTPKIKISYARLKPADITQLQNTQITTPWRTLLDLLHLPHSEFRANSVISHAVTALIRTLGVSHTALINATNNPKKRAHLFNNLCWVTSGAETNRTQAD